METENVERGGAAAKQNPQGDGAGRDGAKRTQGMIVHVNYDIEKVYDNANLQRLYMAMIEGLVTAIVPAIVDECRKVADGLDSAIGEVAKEAMRKERGEA